MSEREGQYQVELNREQLATVQHAMIPLKSLTSDELIDGGADAVSRAMDKALRQARDQVVDRGQPTTLHSYSYYLGMVMALAEVDRALKRT